jgi:hypothetical protein
MALAGLLAGSTALGANDRGQFNSACRNTANAARRAALAQAQADFMLDLAKASNLPITERKDALREALESFKEARQEVKEQYQARLELCEALGESRYNPVINPADFLTPEQIAASPNPYLPLVPGTLYRYRLVTGEGTEINEVHVTDDTREILGVDCVVVEDTVWLDGELVEHTLDWLTQDKDGNVWYFGERSVEYEDGEVTSLEGSWEAGVDSALPGILMKADPQPGDVYRQEFALGEAEDAAEVLALGQSITVPYSSFANCLATHEFTPLEPDASESKFYAPGIGHVLTVDDETGARSELIAVETD